MSRVSPQKRGGAWYLIRRVPNAFKHVDKRTFVRISTGIKIVEDLRGLPAARVVAQRNDDIERRWRDLDAGRDPDHAVNHLQARRHAERLGLRYQPMSELAAGPLEEVLRRLELLGRTRTVDDPKVIEAALGGVEPPSLKLSGLVEAFETE